MIEARVCLMYFGVISATMFVLTHQFCERTTLDTRHWTRETRHWMGETRHLTGETRYWTGESSNWKDHTRN